MIVEVATAQVQPVVREIQQLRADMNARFEAADARFAQVIEDGGRRDRQLAGLAAQMRLLLAGFGVLVTVLLAVFGFLFAA